MSAFKCPDCWRSVDQNLARCPNCGFPLKGSDLDKKVLVVAVAACLMILATFFVYQSIWDNPSNDPLSKTLYSMFGLGLTPESMSERRRQVDRQRMARVANPQTSPSIELILSRISVASQSTRNNHMSEVANPYGAGQFVWRREARWEWIPLWLVVNDKIYAFTPISFNLVPDSISPVQESDELWAEIGWDKHAGPLDIIPILYRRRAEIAVPRI
jgi:hypothetical protein